MLNCLMQFVYLVYMVNALPTLLYVQHEFNTSKTTRNNTKNYIKQTRQRTTQNEQDKELHNTNKTKNYTKQTRQRTTQNKQDKELNKTNKANNYT